jgi:GntR family transcriptional regulator
MENAYKDWFKIDPQSHLPLYYQIKQNLLSLLADGKYSAGDLLPSEGEMGDCYGVARLTVRQAVGELVREGILIRERGRGTFVAQPKVTHMMVRAAGFSERIRQSGQTPSSKVLSFEIIPFTSELSAHLDLEIGDFIYKLMRIRKADNDPHMIQTTYLEKNRFPGLDKIDFTSNSLYAILQDQFGCLITTAEKVFEPVLLSKEEAVLLETRAGTPALLMEMNSFDQNGIRTEFTKAIVRGDKARIMFKV